MTRTVRAPLIATLFLAACSSTAASSGVRLADGSWHLTCKSSLAACVQKADDVCKGQSYEILRGRHERKMLGHELGESQVEVERSEIVVRCAGKGERLPEPSPPPRVEVRPAAPPGAGHAMKAPAVRPAAPTSPAPVCVKGTTQACVGPGACTGGQVCLPDGSGYGPCDCGPTPEPTPAPSTP